MADGTTKTNINGVSSKFEELNRFLTKNRTRRRAILEDATEAFERIVMLEICNSGKNLEMQVRRLDIDFSAKGGFVAKTVGKNRRAAIAAAFADYLKTAETSLCDNFPSACKIAKDLWGDAEAKKLFPSCKGSQKALESIGFEYRPLASSFDIKFNGPTLVIVRSSVEFLVFDPSEPLIFRSIEDSIYYREDRLSDDYKTLSYINAYDKGNFEPYKLPNPAPYNQQHKIDYGMLLCTFSSPYGNENENKEWLVTPLKIDPPHENDGVGGG